MRETLIPQILRFGVVGGCGFVIDGTLLWLLIGAGLNPFMARALSFPVAVVATWMLNRNWTFRATRDASSRGQFRRYFGVQIVGVGVNYLAYSFVIALYGDATVTVFWAFVVGSALGSIWNFCGARYVAFRA